MVIGNGTAGQTAAAAARLSSRGAEVLVLERHPYPSYHPCALPYVLSGKLGLDDVVERRSRPGVQVIVRAEARRIDPERKEVTFEADGDEERVHYDSLIIATGLRPVLPPIPGRDLEGVSKLWDVEDAERILGWLGEKVAVVGGSATGIETAAELATTGREVTLMEMMDQLMPGKVDPPIASAAAKALSEMGVKVMLRARVEEIRGSGGRVTGVAAAGGRFVEADTVILAAGVRPESRLAAEAGLPIGETGGLVVDDEMRVVKDVYAAGDVAEVKNLVSGRPMVTGLASTALVQGRVAGENSVGGRTKYPGALCPYVLRFGEYELGGVGLTAGEAFRLGMEYKTGSFSGSDRPRYSPDRERVTGWFVADPEGRLLGAQFFGRRGIRERVALATLAIRMGMRIQDLRLLEYPYNPEVCDVAEPAVVLAEVLWRKYFRRTSHL